MIWVSRETFRRLPVFSFSRLIHFVIKHTLIIKARYVATRSSQIQPLQLPSTDSLCYGDTAFKNPS